MGREEITVEILPVKWQHAFERYNDCLGKLLPYDFEEIRHTDIYFASNSEDVDLAARRALQRIIDYIKTGAKISKIVLKGYTDNKGNYSHNRRLAGRRAESVQAHLVNNGIDPKIIDIQDVFSRYRLIAKGRKGRRVHVQLLH